MHGSFSLSALFSDFRYALRSVRTDARLFLLAALIVGLGVGACTAVYSLLSPLMVRDLPFEDPDRLVWIANDGGEGMSSVTSRTSNLMDFREISQSFEAITGYMAFFQSRSYTLTGDGEPEKLVGADVAQNFLDVLGVQVRHGRNFDDEEGKWGGRRAAILEHGFWTRRFAADPTVVGTSILLNGESTEIVGVLAPTFDFASVFAPQSKVDFLRPFPISAETDRWGNTLSMIGRLKPGATVAGAQADLDRVIDSLEQADPERWGLGAVVSGLQEQIMRPFRNAGMLLAAAALAVLLIVCVNLSNLLLARSSRRQEEMAVRSALGASRSRLVRQLLLESLILSAVGAALGAALAVVATRFVANASALDIPMLQFVAVDGSALLFAALLATATAMVAGIMPALETTRRDADTFRGSARGSSSDRGRTRMREALVVAEITLACMLLVFGGLMLESFRNVLEVDLGFEASELVRWQVNSTRNFESLAEANRYFDQLIDGVESVAGVESAGLTDSFPLGRNRTWNFGAPGYEYEGDASLGAYVHVVDHRYLEAMGMPLLRGRQLTADDNADQPSVVIVNETAARSVFHGEPALGRTVQVGRDTEVQIIGVVADVRHRSLEASAGPQVYLPMTQVGDFQTLDMVVRSSLSTEALAPGVMAAMRSHDATLPVRDFQAVDAVVDQSVSPRRFTLQLLGAFAGAALLLATLGVYGVLSYAVSERARELGIRMALGETSNSVLAKVVGKSVLLAVIGLGLGAVASMALARSVKSLLFGVEPSDPRVYLLMAMVLLVVSAVAGLLPAWRASRLDLAAVLKAS